MRYEIHDNNSTWLEKQTSFQLLKIDVICMYIYGDIGEFNNFSVVIYMDIPVLASIIDK